MSYTPKQHQKPRRLRSKGGGTNLDGAGEVLELLGLLLPLGLLLIGLLELEAVLGHANELGVLELLELGGGVLVDGVDHEEDLEVLLLEDLQEGRVADLGEGLSGEVVDVLLALGHAGDVVWVAREVSNERARGSGKGAHP